MIFPVAYGAWILLVVALSPRWWISVLVASGGVLLFFAICFPADLFGPPTDLGIPFTAFLLADAIYTGVLAGGAHFVVWWLFRRPKA